MGTEAGWLRWGLKQGGRGGDWSRGVGVGSGDGLENWGGVGLGGRGGDRGKMGKAAGRGRVQY